MELNANLVLTPQSSAPGSPVEGQIYYNSTTKNLQVHDGASFVDGNKSSFMYVVGDVLAFTNTTEATKKTITFNKAVDWVEITFAAANTTASQSVTTNLYKNASQLVAVTDFQVLFSDRGGGSTTNFYSVNSNSILSTIVGTGAPQSAYVCRVIIKTAFAATDTLVIKSLVSANTGNIWDIKVYGYKNKSTNTEWVTIS